MIKVITLTTEAMQAIRSAARGNEYEAKGTQRKDNMWEVSLPEEVIERMEGVRLLGESYSDVIVRTVALYHSAGKPN